MPQRETIKIIYKKSEKAEKPHLLVNNEVWKWNSVDINYKIMAALNNFAVDIIKNDEDVRKGGELEIIIKK